MNKIYTIILFCSVTTQACSQACDSLFSSCIGTFSRNGYYFDLQADSDVTVTGFSYMVQNTGVRDVSVYYRQGTYFGFEGVAGNWTFLGKQVNVTPLNALSCPLPLNAIDVLFSICIPQGIAYGFYIVMSAGTGTLESHSNLAEGGIGAQDAYLKLITGKGQQGIGDFTGTLTPSLTFQGGIQYDCGCLSTTMNELSTNQILVFPNPVQGTINFSGADKLIKRVVIFDSTGAMVFVSDEATCNISALANGLYFAELIQPNGNVKRTRFVKE